MCVYVCVCMCVCICACMCVCVRALGAHVYQCVCGYCGISGCSVCTYVCMYIYYYGKPHKCTGVDVSG